MVCRGRQLDFKSEDLISTTCRIACMQQLYFFSSYCAEKMCISLGLFMVNYSRKMNMKENTFPSQNIVSVTCKNLSEKLTISTNKILL
jgi:hypothetical protein